MHHTFQSRPTTTTNAAPSEVSSSIPGVERCISCRYAIKNARERSDHYHSAWHSLNVKRRCTSLPPIPKDIFEGKFAKFQKSTSSGTTSSSLAYRCKACKKTFKTAAAAESHTSTKKHKQNEIKFRHEARVVEQQREIQAMILADKDKDDQSANADDEDAVMNEPREVPPPKKKLVMGRNDVIEVEARRPIPPRPAPTSNDELLDRDPIPINGCLFCTHMSDDEHLNVSHMFDVHGFVVPHQKRLISLPGLLENAGIYVGVFYQCPWCWLRFSDVMAVRNHMTDVGHCKLNVENGMESPFGESFVWGKLASADERDVALRETGGVIAINDSHELVRASGSVIGHRSNAVMYRQRPIESREPQLTQEQFISQLNNPLRSFKMQLAQRRGLLHGPVQGTAKAHRSQARSSRRTRDETRIGVSTKADKLVEHFKSQNPMVY